MSGALVDLVSKGAQDVYLTGKPEVSFFRSAYKRHTNFSFRPYRLDYTGTFNANHDVVVKIPPKGDLLSYIWIENAEINDVTSSNSLVNTYYTDSSPTDIELYIGGQLIDRQDSMFQSLVWPYAGYADTTSKCDAAQHWSMVEGDPSESAFFPLHFFFCDSYKNALPMLALQYHEVEIRIKCRPGLNDLGGAPKIYANYIFLDTDERQHFVDSDQQILIPQVQRISVSATDTSIDTSYFNHPVQALHLAGGPLSFKSMSLYINGTNLFEDMSIIYFHNVVPYHHAKHTPQHIYSDKNNNPLYTIPFTLSMSWTQPGGSLNFSRLDNSTIKIDSPTSMGPSPVYLYAVNWNVLRLKNGMAGLAFSN